MKTKTLISTYFILVILAAVMVAIFYNPTFSSYKDIERSQNSYPDPNFFEIESIDFSSIPKPIESHVKQFRNGGYRQAMYEVDFNPDHLNKKDHPKIRPINYGAHTASKSSPIDSDNFIILAGDYGLIQILNKTNLDIYWTIQLYDSSRGMHGTPITFYDYMFIGDYSGNFYFFDLKNKKLLWVIDLGDGLGATPYFDGQHIYANVELSNPVNGYIVKIDPIKKKIIWKSKFYGEQSHSSVAANADSLFFGDNDGDFYKLSKSDGKVLWKKYLSKPIKSTPVFFKNSVIFSSWNKMLYSFDQSTGRLLWTYELPNENQSSMAVDEKEGVGFINSTLGVHKIDLNSGKKMQIFGNKMDSGAAKASPIIVKYKGIKRVLTSCKTNSFCILDSSDLKLLNIIDIGSSVSNQAGVLENAILINGDQGGDYIYLDSHNGT